MRAMKVNLGMDATNVFLGAIVYKEFRVWWSYTWCICTICTSFTGKTSSILHLIIFLRHFLMWFSRAPWQKLTNLDGLCVRRLYRMICSSYNIWSFIWISIFCWCIPNRHHVWGRRLWVDNIVRVSDSWRRGECCAVYTSLYLNAM